MQARAYQRCPLCARVTPLSAASTRCPHDGAVMLTHCLRCGAAIRSPFADCCATCGASYQDSDFHLRGEKEGSFLNYDSSQVETPL